MALFLSFGFALFVSAIALPVLQAELRVIIRVEFGRDRRIYRLAPGKHQFMEFGGFFGHYLGEVVLFSYIVLEVVKFQRAVLKIFDELPVARSHGSAGPCSKIRVSGTFGFSLEISGEMPEDGLAFQTLSAFEKGHDAPAIQ